MKFGAFSRLIPIYDKYIGTLKKNFRALEKNFTFDKKNSFEKGTQKILDYRLKFTDNVRINRQNIKNTTQNRLASTKKSSLS